MAAAAGPFGKADRAVTAGVDGDVLATAGEASSLGGKDDGPAAGDAGAVSEASTGSCCDGASLLSLSAGSTCLSRKRGLGKLVPAAGFFSVVSTWRETSSRVEKTVSGECRFPSGETSLSMEVRDTGSSP